MARIILYSNDTIGEKMAGPGIRYVQMARAFGKNHTVLLAAPSPSKYQDSNFQFYTYKKPKDLLAQIPKAQVIIAQKLPPVLLKAVRKNNIKFIADFYDPIVLENLEANRTKPIDHQVAIYNFESANQALQLSVADHILVASERQRDYWIGVLSSLGRIIPEVYSEDVSLNHLISILPFGVEKKQPKIDDEEAILKLIPNFTKDDKVILWGGGIWNWFDPLSVIEAINIIKTSHPEVKLLFLGIKHPNPDAPEMEMTAKAIKLADEMKLTGRHVFFNYQWVPYDERQNYVLQCFAAVSTHFDHVETRLSFRTRIVDSYIWANLPIIATRGDSMADLIEKRKLGTVVNYVDSKQIAEAIKTMIEDKKFYQECQENVSVVREEFIWDNLILSVEELFAKNKWTEITLNEISFKQLISLYFKAGLQKVLIMKGWTGVLAKILKK